MLMPLRCPSCFSLLIPPVLLRLSATAPAPGSAQASGLLRPPPLQLLLSPQPQQSVSGPSAAVYARVAPQGPVCCSSCASVEPCAPALGPTHAAPQAFVLPVLLLSASATAAAPAIPTTYVASSMLVLLLLHLPALPLSCPAPCIRCCRRRGCCGSTLLPRPCMVLWCVQCACDTPCPNTHARACAHTHTHTHTHCTLQHCMPLCTPILTCRPSARPGSGSHRQCHCQKS